MSVEHFAEIADEFHRRVERIVWCSVATQDRNGRLRSRVLHPIWEKPSETEPFGWVLTGRQSHKVVHLENNPYVSLSYWDPQHEQVYVDARAQWQDDPKEKTRIWEEFVSRPDPYGYDPGTIWHDGPQDPAFGVLELLPWRVELYGMAAMSQRQPARVWRSSP